MIVQIFYFNFRQHNNVQLIFSNLASFYIKKTQIYFEVNQIFFIYFFVFLTKDFDQ